MKDLKIVLGTGKKAHPIENIPYYLQGPCLDSKHHRHHQGQYLGKVL